MFYAYLFVIIIKQHKIYTSYKKETTMFKSSSFSIIEWIIFLIILPIPIVDFIFIIWVGYHIGFIALLKKLAISLGIYVLLVFAALAFGGVKVN